MKTWSWAGLRLLTLDPPVLCSAEIRRRGSKDLLKVSVLTQVGEEGADEGQPVPPQIYDVPYEGNGESDRSAVARAELDPRPPAEYELPWEWKKERIVRTLSGTQLLGHAGVDGTLYAKVVKVDLRMVPLKLQPCQYVIKNMTVLKPDKYVNYFLSLRPS